MKYDIALQISGWKNIKAYFPPCANIALQLLSGAEAVELKFSDYTNLSLQLVDGSKLDKTYFSGAGIGEGEVNASIQATAASSSYGTFYKESSAINVGVSDQFGLNYSIIIDPSIENQPADFLRIEVGDGNILQFNLANYPLDSKRDSSYSFDDCSTCSLGLSIERNNESCAISTTPPTPQTPENSTLPSEVECDAEIYASPVTLTFEVITREPIIEEKFDFENNINKVPYPGKNEPLQLYDYTGTDTINQWLVVNSDGPIIIDDVELSDPYGVQIKTNNSNVEVKSNRTENQWVKPNLLT